MHWKGFDYCILEWIYSITYVYIYVLSTLFSAETKLADVFDFLFCFLYSILFVDARFRTQVSYTYIYFFIQICCVWTLCEERSKLAETLRARIYHWVGAGPVASLFTQCFYPVKLPMRFSLISEYFAGEPGSCVESSRSDMMLLLLALVHCVFSQDGMGVLELPPAHLYPIRRRCANDTEIIDHILHETTMVGLSWYWEEKARGRSTLHLEIF